MITEYRIRELELGYEELAERLALLERQSPGGASEPLPSPVPVRESPVFEDPPPRAAPRRPATVTFEDLLGGRILALIGAAAIVLAGAFFFALAVSNGWIGEGARTLLAATGSMSLFALGVW